MGNKCACEILVQVPGASFPGAPLHVTSKRVGMEGRIRVERAGLTSAPRRGTPVQVPGASFPGAPLHVTPKGREWNGREWKEDQEDVAN